MEKNLRCQEKGCGGNAYHINRKETGVYEIVCVPAKGKEHPKTISLKEDTLKDLKN